MWIGMQTLSLYKVISSRPWLIFLSFSFSFLLLAPSSFHFLSFLFLSKWFSDILFIWNWVVMTWHKGDHWIDKFKVLSMKGNEQSSFTLSHNQFHDGGGLHLSFTFPSFFLSFFFSHSLGSFPNLLIMNWDFLDRSKGDEMACHLCNSKIFGNESTLFWKEERDEKEGKRMRIQFSSDRTQWIWRRSRIIIHPREGHFLICYLVSMIVISVLWFNDISLIKFSYFCMW